MVQYMVHFTYEQFTNLYLQLSCVVLAYFPNSNFPSHNLPMHENQQLPNNNFSMQ